MVEPVNPELLLIDTDCLIWRFGLTHRDNDPAFPGEEPLTETEALESNLWAAKEAFSQKLEYLLFDTKAKDYRLCLPVDDNVPNFRYLVFPSYKGHRKEKPEIITQLYSWVRETYKDILLQDSGVETDDIIADNHLPNGTTMVVSNDKDMKQLPGWNLNPFTGVRTWITPEEAERFFWYQVLVGDSADGYPGCPKIGDKRAREILELCDHRNFHNVVWFTYLSQRATTADYRMNYELALLGGNNWRYPLGHTLPETYLDVLKEIRKNEP